MTTPGPSVSGQPTPESITGNNVEIVGQPEIVEASDYARLGFGLRQRSIAWDGDAVQAALHTIDNLTSSAARLRSQLAEAREAKDWLAKNVDEALAAIHAAPQEIAPLATPFAPGDLPRAVAALIERAVRILRERDSLREEHTRLVAEVRAFAKAWGAPMSATMRTALHRLELVAAAPPAQCSVYNDQPGPCRACGGYGSDPHGCDDQCVRAAEHGMHPPVAPTPPCGHRSGIHDEHCDVINDPDGAADELDEALAGAMSALEWAANHISLARSCARAALGSTPDTGSTA